MGLCLHRVGPDRNMGVIEFVRCLEPEEEAHVLVRIGLDGRLEFHIEDEIPEHLVGQQRNVEG